MRCRRGRDSSIFFWAWQRASLCWLALRWLASSRSRWSCAGFLRQPSPCCGQRTWLSSVLSQLHPDRKGPQSTPFLLRWRPVSCLMLFGNYQQSYGAQHLAVGLDLPPVLPTCSLPYLGARSHRPPTHTSLLPLPRLPPHQFPGLRFKARSGQGPRCLLLSTRLLLLMFLLPTTTPV